MQIGETMQQRKCKNTITTVVVAITIYELIFTQLYSMITLPGIVEILFLLLLVVCLVFSGVPLRIKNRQAIWLFPVIALIAQLAIQHNRETLRDCLTWVVCVYIIVKADRATNETLQPLMKIYIVSGIVYGCSILFQYMFPLVYFATIYPLFKPNYALNVMQSWNGSRHAAMGLAHNIGFTIGYVIVGMLAFVFKKRERIKAKDVILFVFFFVVLIMSTKRAHLLFGLTCVIYIYLLSAPIGHKASRYITLALIGLVAIFIIVTNLNQINSTSAIGRVIQSISDASAGEDISNGRSIMAGDALAIWMQSPIWGIGWKGFANVGSAFTTVHNVYLQLLCETGIVGLLCFAIPMFYSLYSSLKTVVKYRSIRNENYYKLCYSAAYQMFFVIYGLTGNPLFDYTYVVPYLFAIAIFIVAQLLWQMTKKNEWVLF